MNKRLAIITSHPIQYNAPFFRELSKLGTVDLMVFYTWDKGVGAKHDPGFGEKIEWDIPLLEGYNYTFVKNIAKNPGSHQYNGIICPSLISKIEAFTPNAILIYGWNFHAHHKAMRYFKGKIPVWFRGDSNLLDYNIRSFKELLKACLHSPLSQYLSLNRQYAHYLLRKIYLTHIYKNIDVAFYVGTNNKEYYLAHGLKESQLDWMPHAVNNDFFSELNEPREYEALEWRRSLGIDANAFVLLFAGKFEPKKNPDLLISAIHQINQSSTKTSSAPIHLILVGNGILASRIKELASDAPYIHFLPFQNQSQMPKIYRLGNVICLSSKGPGETWGLVLNESLACGRPIIASDKVGSAIDLVPLCKGQIFKNDSLNDLINAILESQKNRNNFSIDDKFQKFYSYSYDCQIIQKQLSLF